MNRKDKIECFLWLVCLSLVFIWVGYVNAHDPEQVKPKPVVINKVNTDSQDEIKALRNRLQELEADLKQHNESRIVQQKAIETKQKNLALQQRSLKRILNTPKPVTVVIPKPVRNPKVKMYWTLNKYYAENPENYPVKCIFIATSKHDDDQAFTLLAGETLGYKIKFRQEPTLECRG